MGEPAGSAVLPLRDASPLAEQTFGKWDPVVRWQTRRQLKDRVVELEGRAAKAEERADRAEAGWARALGEMAAQGHELRQALDDTQQRSEEWQLAFSRLRRAVDMSIDLVEVAGRCPDGEPVGGKEEFLVGDGEAPRPVDRLDDLVSPFVLRSVPA